MVGTGGCLRGTSLNTEVELLREPDVEDVRVVEGLPGVGHVGKLAAEHLIEVLNAEKFAEVYSHHLPPQVLIDEGEARLVSIDLYASEEESVVMIVGDHQAVDNQGHYEVVEAVLDTLEQTVAPSIVYTLGGFGIGEIPEEPAVLGAVSEPGLKAHLEEAGVVFEEGRPGGGIVGASGLFLGLGRLRGMDAACLMGETSGYLVDPKAAQAVLKVLSELLDVEVDLSELEKKAEELEEFVYQMMQQAPQETPTRREDLRYIG